MSQFDFVENLRETTKSLSLAVGLRAKIWTVVCVSTKKTLILEINFS
jgi:hypothetical protein